MMPAPLQAARHMFHTETLDHITGANVFVVLKGHATFLAGIDFANFILEALECLQAAFVNDDAVANEANTGAALNLAFCDPAPGNPADFGDVEDFENFSVTKECLTTFWRQHA